jgi:hypothetical protein
MNLVIVILPRELRKLGCHAILGVMWNVEQPAFCRPADVQRSRGMPRLLTPATLSAAGKPAAQTNQYKPCTLLPPTRFPAQSIIAVTASIPAQVLHP